MLAAGFEKTADGVCDSADHGRSGRRNAVRSEKLSGMKESIEEQIEKACERICDEICKWPEYYEQMGLDNDRMYEEKCEHCPLNMLI